MPAYDHPLPPRRSVQERNQLVEAHLAFAESFVRKRYARTNAPDVVDDLIQISFEALIRAADRWDETKGTFRSYAEH